MMKKLQAPSLAALLLLVTVAASSTSLLPVANSSAATIVSCVPSQMRVIHGASQGTAGTTYIPLIFTNAGRTCAIWGVPSVQPTLATRRHVGPTARNEAIGEMPARHVLAKGQSVSVAFGVVETGNYTPSSCVARGAAGVVVALGTFVRPTYVHLSILVCTKRASTTTRLIAPGRAG